MAIIRKGMWATSGGVVGIVAGIGPQQAIANRQKAIPAGMVDFHVTDALGNTAKEQFVDIRSISQAAYLDIPEARRPDEATARQLGYL